MMITVYTSNDMYYIYLYRNTSVGGNTVELNK